MKTLLSLTSIFLAGFLVLIMVAGAVADDPSIETQHFLLVIENDVPEEIFRIEANGKIFGMNNRFIGQLTPEETEALFKVLDHYSLHPEKVIQ